MAENGTEKVLGEVKLGEWDRLVVQEIRRKSGDILYDVRLWVNDPRSGYSGPTKKGIRVSAEALNDLVGILSVVLMEAKL